MYHPFYILNIIIIMGTLSNNSKVGDKGKDLILQTSGRVYVQVKDRFYEIKFRNEEKEEEKQIPPIIFIEDSSELTKEYPYPGDDYLIISNDGRFFRTSDNTYYQIELSQTTTTTFNSPLTINTLEAPLKISSTQLVKNLNSEYLNGITSDKFARKDIEESINKWTIKNLNSNYISSNNESTILDLENSILTINTIRVNSIINSSESEDSNSQEESNSNIDIINKPTYFSNGIQLLSVATIDKMQYYFSEEGSDELQHGNENAEVGGFSIADLILEAYDNGFLIPESEDQNISYFANLLTTAEEFVNGSWIAHTITDNDFSYSEDDSTYRNYFYLRFTPKERSVFESVTYGVDSNCAIKIYDRWYNISNYTGEIKNKYKGITFECTIDNSTLKAGDILSGSGSDGILEALVVGSTENKIRLITSGIDCCFEYKVPLTSIEEWEQYPPEEDSESYDEFLSVTSCEDAQDLERGKTISAKLKVGNILFTEDSENIIGNITGIENSIFGTLEGYGLSSEGNCYFVNPGIAWTNESGEAYIKLTNQSDSFIGGSEGTSWINIKSNGDCSIKCLDMYDINTTGSCFFGPITIYKDGSAIIGNRINGISINSLGQVSIPKSCIVE